MPQFDQITFFNQVFWFICVLFCFYFITLYFFVPFLCFNFKYRKKKQLQNKEFLKNINFEYFFQFIFIDIFFQKICIFLNSYLLEIFSNFNHLVKGFKVNLYHQLKFKKILIIFWVSLITYPIIFISDL